VAEVEEGGEITMRISFPIRAINIIWLAQTSLTNLNSGLGGSHLVDLKRYSFGGHDYPYVSGQAMRYYLQEALRRELRADQYKLTNDKGERSGDIEKDILSDLFGFMKPEKKKGAVKRVSPVKMSPAMGLEPLKDSLTVDLLTRQKLREETEKQSGDIVDVEIAANIYRAGLSVDVARVGGEEEFDLKKLESKGIHYKVSDAERRERLVKLFAALKNLSDYSKQARLLTDFTPDFVLISVQNIYNHLLQKAIDLSNGSNGEHRVLNVNRLGQVIRDLPVASVIMAGLLKGTLTNEKIICDELKTVGVDVSSPQQALSELIGLLQDKENKLVGE
jgi:CRISPR-associated protein Cst2